MSDSILSSTKRALSIPVDYSVFDADIVMHINSVFSTLNQMGVGPIDGFEIEDSTALWDQFLLGNARMNFIKTYMYLRVRLIFDPPTTSYLITAYENQKTELEWRISVQRETRTTLLLGGHKNVTGNLGDEHRVRLTNPTGQTLINADGLYEAEFVPSGGRNTQSATLDASQRSSGLLFLSVVIKNGVYTVRRTNPRRTILVLEVSAE